MGFAFPIILGLEDIHALTSDGRRYQLRVDVQAANGSLYYEVYDDFSIGPAKNFTLHIGSYRGTAGMYTDVKKNASVTFDTPFCINSRLFLFKDL